THHFKTERVKRTAMAQSKQIAGLLGPAMIAVGATEALNMNVFSEQIAPVVYLNGTILFVVGLALVRAHNLWTWTWSTIVTITGWVVLLGGLYRMVVPRAPQAPDSVVTYAMLAAIITIGMVLSYKGYTFGSEGAEESART
ncbi:MAG TPA: hypothetical protein VF395_20340, partial [Polyangiaceae bacterium]